MNKFIGCIASYKNCDIALFGAPYDGSASFKKGTKEGPLAIRNESDGLETYSPYLDKDLEDINVCDMGDLKLQLLKTNEVIDAIYTHTKRIIKDNKFPFMLGGEHSISFGTIKALAEVYPDLHIIHFDAHTDLRDGFLGDYYSHASVIRRAHDMVGDHRIFQFGIRSGLKEEFQFAEEHNYINKFNLDTLDSVIETLIDKPVYITIDLDILDPAYFPGTGTQEPGGITFNELLQGIIQFSKLNNIVGADVVELSPPLDQSGASTAVACKVVRELLLSIK